MKEILEYLYSEIKELNEKSDTLNNELRKMESELEAASNTLLKLVNEQERLLDPFSCSSNKRKFNDVEIKKIEQDNKHLKEKILVKTQLLDKYSLKIKKIYNLIQLYNEDVNKVKYNDNFVDKPGCQNYLSEQISNDLSECINNKVLQNISSLLSKNKFITQMINNDIQRAKFELDSENVLIEQSVDLLNDITFILNPNYIKELGYEYQIRRIISIIKKNSKANIFFDFADKRYSKDISVLDDVYIIMSVRIILELCDSLIRLVNCSDINLSVMVDDNKILISEVNSECDFNINILKDRLFSIVSEKNIKFKYYKKSDFKIEVVIPLHKEKHNDDKCSISR